MGNNKKLSWTFRFGVLGGLFSLLPDIDHLIGYIVENNPTRDYFHYWIYTHSPFSWFVFAFVFGFGATLVLIARK